MKKLIVFGIAFMLISLQQSHAQDSVQVNPLVAKTFGQSFAGAKNVYWVSLPKKVTQAQFNYQGASWLAYFDEAGNVITCGRRIKTISDLPLKVQDGFRRAKTRLEKREGASQVILIYEMMKDESTKYFISLQTDSNIATFSFSSDGYASLENRKPRTVMPDAAAPKDVIARKNQ